jgi:hypothetical protein
MAAVTYDDYMVGDGYVIDIVVTITRRVFMMKIIVGKTVVVGGDDYIENNGCRVNGGVI